MALFASPGVFNLNYNGETYQARWNLPRFNEDGTMNMTIENGGDVSGRFSGFTLDGLNWVEDSGSGLETLYLDFVNGIYRLKGVNKTLADVLEEDLNWGAFNPANVAAGVGLAGGASTNPTLTSEAAEDLLNGFTATITWTNDANPGQGAIDLYVADYSTDLTANYVNTAAAPFIKDQAGTTHFIGSALTAGNHTADIMASGNSLSMTLDGNLSDSFNPAGATVFEKVSFWLDDAGSHIKTIAFTAI